MTVGQAVKIAAVRAGLGVLLVGGGAFAVVQLGRSDAALFWSWAYMFGARIAAWWLVGAALVRLRGHRLVGWIVGGTAMNAAIDLAVVAGLGKGWVYPTAAALALAAFVAILHKTGRRDALRLRFADYPTCAKCTYNLTGNLSGICPECGTPITSPSICRPADTSHGSRLGRTADRA
jgi:hypothetical protein